ncbi:hypothetical protein HPP92_014132 [Vanilla planifolia]|uniref:AMP-dependent synthetase/ligase domain-containing protein n=1 Tax=Vanilla planifolia TaxID=51239 RepID=A0A835UWK8_VANPL|nr:hypothetical protein HPP92_014132 [Vanilla planifolia]
MASASRAPIDTRSGFCPSESIFYSKRKPVDFPSDPHLDVTTFISSRRHSGTIALIDASTGRRVAYTELWGFTASVSCALSSTYHVRKGDVVLLLSPNSIYFPIVSLAVMSLGAILTTTNPLNTAREISNQIADSSPVLAFTTRTLLPKLSATFLNLPIVLLEDSRSADEDPGVVSTIQDLISTSPQPRRAALQ